MRIEDVRVTRVATQRIYETRTGKLSVGQPGRITSTFLLLELATDTGHVGLGEISDLEDDFGLNDDQVRRLVLDGVRGADPFEIARIHSRLAEQASANGTVYTDGTVYDIVACGVDIALYDLMGKATGLPAAKLADGLQREKVWVSWVIYTRAPGEDMAAELEERKRQGFTAFKLKVGSDIDLDEARIKLVREICGDGVHIKIDPNSAWSEAEAIGNLKRLEKYNIAGAETPVPYRDILSHARVRRLTGVPVIEHVHDLEYALALIKVNGVDVFNVSACGAGGIWRAKRVLTMAEAAGIPALLGSTVELGVGTAAQLHLAASTANVTWPSDLIGPLMYVDDVLAQPWRWHAGGYLEVPQGPGLGVSLDPARVARLKI